MVLLFATSKKYDKVLYTPHNWLSPSLNNCHLHEIALFFVLPTYVEIILMRWLHDPIVKKLCQNPWNRLALLEVPKVLTDFTLTYRKALIPDGQGAIKLEHVYCWAHKIFTVFSIYASLQAGRYIKRPLTLLLQFGWSLDWHRPVVSLQSGAG